jgi:hypothetical protein
VIDFWDVLGLLPPEHYQKNNKFDLYDFFDSPKTKKEE